MSDRPAPKIRYYLVVIAEGWDGGGSAHEFALLENATEEYERAIKVPDQVAFIIHGTVVKSSEEIE